MRAALALQPWLAMYLAVALVLLAVLPSCSDRAADPPPPSPPPPAALPADAAIEPAALLDAPRTRVLEPGASHRYRLPLGRGASCEVVVTQDGVDVVVEVIDPTGARIASVDSPNGRHGDEPVELFAIAGGDYQLVVRSIDRGEPAGRYAIKLARRDEAATRRLLDERARARSAAAAWLGSRAGPIRLAEARVEGPGLERFDALARRSRVVGLGEATHGSRQFGDLRLALTRRAIERHGVRLVGLEASAARMREVDRWTRRDRATAAELEALLGTGGWINRRAFLALAGEVRGWNLAHPRDPVAIVGLDDQDNAPARDAVAAFAARAYDPAFAGRVREVLARIARADAEAAVFGPSDVSPDDWRFLVRTAGLLEARRPVFAARFGAAAADDAIAAAWTLARFAEFNAGVRDEPAYGRDWMMAAGLLRVFGPTTRALYWGHNAHVKHPAEPRGDATTAGGLLAEALRGDYAAIAITFLEGGFLAQRPNDPQDRLEVFNLPAAAADSIDGVLASLGTGDLIAAWPDGRAAAPPWLLDPRPMRWIGALFAPGSLPGEASRPMQIVADFDGVAFLAHVDAETSTELGKNRAP